MAEIEGGYGATLYRLHRDVTGVKLDLRKLLTQAGLTPTTDEETDNRWTEHGRKIDAALDES